MKAEAHSDIRKVSICDRSMAIESVCGWNSSLSVNEKHWEIRKFTSWRQRWYSRQLNNMSLYGRGVNVLMNLFRYHCLQKFDFFHPFWKHDGIKKENKAMSPFTGQYSWIDVITITLLFLNETEFFKFCKDLLESHYLYGHLEAENLVRVRHSGAGKQSLQYPQRMAWDLPPGQHQLHSWCIFFDFLGTWHFY